MGDYQYQLRSDVEKSIGYKLVSTSEARNLIDTLTENGIEDLSLSTIRRFWGLIPERKASKHTLNRLSEFLGYKSFLDYVKQKSRFEQLDIDTRIQQIKFKNDLSADDFAFMESLYARTNSTQAVLSLFEHAVHFNKWDYLTQLFDPKKNKLLQVKDHRNSFVVELAYQISIFLNAIPGKYFKTILGGLMSISDFKVHVVYIYIDIINLNHRYGKILKRVDVTNAPFEEVLFLSLIGNLRAFLNGHAPALVKINPEQLQGLPEVLLGRYYGYQILYSNFHGKQEHEHLFWQEYLTNITPQTYLRNYLHEFIHHLMLARNFKLLDEVMLRFYEDITGEYNAHSYLDVFIFNVAEVIISHQLNDLKRAHRIFANLNLEKITYGSYCDYYLIFYHILGYHISSVPYLKNQHKAEYLKLSHAAGFALFDETYLEGYLTNEIRE